MNRRLFLLSTAGAGLTLAVGATAFALTRTPTSAVEPWRRAGVQRDDPRLFVVTHAILAPNPHNRQPWIVELTGPRTMTLWCDLDRRLPMTDPFDRQIVIGLGCFVETAALAASAIGYRLDVLPFPDGEPRPRLDQRPVARLELVPSSTPADPLFAHIRDRRSTKRPFDPARPVPDAAAVRLSALSGGGLTLSTVSDPDMVQQLRALSWRAWEIEATTARTHKESVDLMRIGRAEIEANPDGIALGGPMLEALAIAGQLSRSHLLDPASSASQQGFGLYRDMLAATPSYLTVVSGDDTRAGQLTAGRGYMRANLLATALGLALHPISQALQEYAEMDGLRSRLDGMLGIKAPNRLQMLARLGYGPSVAPTPRWAAETRIRTA